MQYQSAPILARKCEIEYWLPCGADGRSGGRAVYGHVITKFSRMGSLPHFLTHGAPLVPLLFLEIERSKRICNIQMITFHSFSFQIAVYLTLFVIGF